MTYLVGQEKPALEDIEHFGVKGMKWGVRRETPKAEGYTRSQRATDQKKFGGKADHRVDKRVAKGKDLQTARAAEAKRQKAIRLAILGAAFAIRFGPDLLDLGGAVANKAASSYVNKKTAAAGAAHTAKMFSDSHGIGAHRIIDLNFDSVSGSFR